MVGGRKDSIKTYKIIVVISVVVTVAAVAYAYSTKVDITTNLLPIQELYTQGYTKVDVQASFSNTVGQVIITGNCYQITANTEPWQAQSISDGIRHAIGSRPNTHDLIRDAFNSLDIKVMMVKIVDIQNSRFIGKLILKDGNKIVSLDSRPSDDMAVAVRTGAPIYIKDDLLKSQGKSIC